MFSPRFVALNRLSHLECLDDTGRISVTKPQTVGQKQAFFTIKTVTKSLYYSLFLIEIGFEVVAGKRARSSGYSPDWQTYSLL